MPTPTVREGRNLEIEDALLLVACNALPAVERMEADQRAPVPVLHGVLYSSTFGFAHLDVSRTGTLIYRRSTARGQLIAAWLDAAGRVEPWLSKPGEYTFPRLSPDGRRLAFVSAEGGIRSVWVRERASERTTRLSASPLDYSPIWCPDGRGVVALLPAEATGEQSPSHVTFALNFAQEVHRRVQSRGR